MSGVLELLQSVPESAQSPELPVHAFLPLPTALLGTKYSSAHLRFPLQLPNALESCPVRKLCSLDASPFLTYCIEVEFYNKSFLTPLQESGENNSEIPPRAGIIRNPVQLRKLSFFPKSRKTAQLISFPIPDVFQCQKLINRSNLLSSEFLQQ